MSNPASTTDLNDIWSSICLELQQVVSPDAVTRWFRPLTLHSYANKTLTLGSDNSIYQYWIEENYGSQLKAVAARVLGETIAISFLAQSDSAGPITPDVPAQEEPARPVKKEVVRMAPQQASSSPKGCLNPRSTFESFVVGVNNRFAHATCPTSCATPSIRIRLQKQKTWSIPENPAR